MKKLLLIILSQFFTIIVMGQTWIVFNTTNSPLPSDGIHEIKQDKKGNYWIATARGLVKYDINGNWTVYTHTNSNINWDGVQSIAIDTNDVVWIGYGISGIAKFNGTNFTNYNISNILGIPGWHGTGDVMGLDFDKNNNLWIATYNGLLKFDGTNFTRWHSGNGLIGGTDLNGSPSNRVWSVLCDKTTNNIWVGTFHEGLLKFDGTNFTQYYMFNPSTFMLNQVNQIYFDLQNDIWVTGYGVVEFDRTTMNKKSVYTSNNGLGDPLVWGISIDQGNKLWIGSDYLYGLFMKDASGWHIIDSSNSGLPDHCNGCSMPTNHVENIYVDKHNNKWFSTWTGVVIYNEAGVNLTSINKLSSECILNVYPNPTSDIITINAKNFTNGNYNISVTNLLGQVIKQKEIKINGAGIETTFDLDGLNAGSYFLIIEGDGYRKTTKIIKH